MQSATLGVASLKSVIFEEELVWQPYGYGR